MSTERENDFFGRHALIVAEHGFTVTPTKGKRPVLRNWQNPKATDLKWLTRMVAKPRYAGCNIGIVCGRVVAIDIDASDPVKSERIQALAAEHLGPTAFKRVGRAPRCVLLYRPAEPIASTKFGCAEVLSSGLAIRGFRNSSRHGSALLLGRSKSRDGQDRGSAGYYERCLAGIR
jgi:hypothetical protein